MPVQPRHDLAAERLVALEHVAHHAAPAGEVDQVGLEPDQAARRDGAFEADAVRMVLHVGDLGLAASQILHHVAETFVGHFDPQRLERFQRAGPAGSFFRITSGRETRTSYPSRRICSTSTAICISPRALTRKM